MDHKEEEIVIVSNSTTCRISTRNNFNKKSFPSKSVEDTCTCIGIKDPDKFRTHLGGFFAIYKSAVVPTCL